jgi:hypothetical protein
MVVTRQAERCDDDVRYLICLVEHLYCGCEGFEIRDWGVRE